MMIAFIIWTIVALVFFCIGISARKSKTAVGFFTFVKPPKVKDIKRYNRAVSTMWIVGDIVFELMGVPFLLLKQNSAGYLLITIGMLFWVIILMIVYMKIEAKYKQ